MTPPRYTADAPGTAVIAAPSRPPVSDSAVARVCPRSPSTLTIWAASSPEGYTGPSWPAARAAGPEHVTAGPEARRGREHPAAGAPRGRTRGTSQPVQDHIR